MAANNNQQAKHLAPKRSDRQQGQALVEMAMMLTVVLLLLGFTLDIGRAYYSFLALKDAAGEGAYYGSVHPTWRTHTDCANPQNVTYRVQHAAPPGGLVDLQSTTVNVSAPDVSAGNMITVTVSTTFELLAPFTPIFVGGQTLPLTAVSSARILAPASVCE